MLAGKLDKQIVLQSVTVTNDLGSVTETYATVATVFGHVITQKGEEAFESARVNAKETIRVMIRYRADVTVRWRIQYESQTYNIIAIDRSGSRKGELWMTCEAVGAV